MRTVLGLLLAPREVSGVRRLRGFVVPLSLVLSCASPPDATRVTVLYPDTDEPVAPAYTNFIESTATPPLPGPLNYLDLKCASLDCHGQLGRPLRLYSRNGLRLFDPVTGEVPRLTGRDALAEEEKRANYISVIAVEPEIMGQVYLGGLDVENLMLFRKALAKERHKGGQVMLGPSDPGYRCLQSWILDDTLDRGACQQAVQSEN